MLLNRKRTSLHSFKSPLMSIRLILCCSGRNGSSPTASAVIDDWLAREGEMLSSQRVTATRTKDGRVVTNDLSGSFAHHTVSNHQFKHPPSCNSFVSALRLVKSIPAACCSLIYRIVKSVKFPTAAILLQQEFVQQN